MTLFLGVLELNLTFRGCTTTLSLVPYFGAERRSEKGPQKTCPTFGVFLCTFSVFKQVSWRFEEYLRKAGRI